MSEQERNDAVDKIIGNMTAEMQTIDGQYNPLGFQPANEPLNWNHQQQYGNPYYHHQPDMNYVPIQQQFNPPYGYVQQPFDLNEYNKNLALNTLKYNLYESMQNDPSVFALLNSNLPAVNNNFVQNEPAQTSNSGLFDNLVGNWAPNTSGTYSPFGEPFNPSVSLFEKPPEKENIPESLQEQTEEKQIQFTKNNKPRMVAEVKPMRPSYSDVLTKSVPAKPLKNDAKDFKLKSGKDIGKKVKTPKPLSRPETLPTDKTPLKTSKERRPRNNQLNRKWSSLDDIKETIYNDKTEEKKKPEPIQKNMKSTSVKKVTKTTNDIIDNDANNARIDSLYVNKNGVKKTKSNARPKTDASIDKTAKRATRFRKKECNNALSVFTGVIGQKIKHYLAGWWRYLTMFLFWLVHLISDICSLSIHIGQYMATNTWQWLCLHWYSLLDLLSVLIQRNRLLSWLWSKIKKADKPKSKDNNRSFLSQSGLKNNINMPTTGEEAMKRLLACKGKDPYSILGVTPGCTDDDIKKYYKRQAFLVHPDKNQQPGAEEAFKILVHAFDMIGEPDRRAAYDKGVVESVQVEQAWTELNDLLTQLQEKVEAAANTIRCSACGSRHKRQRIERPSYAARNCSSCRIHHSAREGDIWAEARCFGFLWHYYACMDGGVYEITEWAACQKDSLKHLRPDSHQVQYRIALGSKQQQQQQQQQQHQRRHSGSRNAEKQPDLENLLNTLYGQTGETGKKKNKKSK